VVDNIKIMRLIEKINQSRRDFDGVYECENCGNKETHNGCYDDRNFHDNVAPNWKCEKCGKSTIDIKGKSDFVATKYGSHEIV